MAYAFFVITILTATSGFRTVLGEERLRGVAPLTQGALRCMIEAAPSTMEDSPFEDMIAFPIADVLDLHSVSPKDVKDVVEEYLAEARRLGFRKLRIIHGRGIGVQREIVRGVLSRTSTVAEYRDAPAEAGGWGATVVDLV